MPSDLDIEDDEKQPDTESPPFKLLREQRDAATATALAATQELALHKAGLGDLTEKQMNALKGAHGDGEWTSEALKETANEIGMVKSDAEQTTEPKIPDAELQAHQRVAAAAGGQPLPPPPDLTAAIEAAQTPEEIRTILRNADRLAEGD